LDPRQKWFTVEYFVNCILYFDFSVFSLNWSFHPLIPALFWKGEDVVHTAACYFRHSSSYSGSTQQYGCGAVQ